MTSVESFLNGICPYYTMFPVEFPLRQLREARRSQWVLDPFCGRGTTNYAARTLGLPSIGIDSNPVAAAIAQVKLISISSQRVARVCREILEDGPEPDAIPHGEFWERCYEADTLAQLCRVREDLLRDCTTPARQALRALILGCLHGPRTKREPSYLSNQMPRTYAAKPRYAVRFWRSRRMKPPAVNLLKLVRRKAERYFGVLPQQVEGRIVCGDSRSVQIDDLPRRANWVVTSPPYYGMRTYVPDQWLRYWFLGGSADVTYSFDSQLQHGSPDVFVEQLASVWRNVARMCSAGARLVIRFGGIRDRKADPSQLLRESIAKADAWRIQTAHAAGEASAGRRQAGQFVKELGKPVEEYDYFARRV